MANVVSNNPGFEKIVQDNTKSLYELSNIKPIQPTLSLDSKPTGNYALATNWGNIQQNKTALKSIIKKLNDKVKNQAERIILNLSEYEGNVEELKKDILAKTGSNCDLKYLKELIV